MTWFDTKPNGKLTFMGELVDGKLKEPAYECGNPMNRLKQYANNQNPYAPSMQLDPPVTWERIVGYVKYVEKAMAVGYVFECACPASDLVKLPDETYYTVEAHPKFGVKEA